MSALRFCMLTTFYPPYSFGGDAIGIQRLSRGLVRRGHHVTVIHDADAFRVLAPGATPSAPDDDDDQGVRVRRMHTTRPMLNTFLTQQLGRPVVNRARLARMIGEGDFDVVNFHNVSLIGGPGLFKLGADAVTVYMAHEHWLVCPMHVLWRHKRERCDARQCLRCAIAYRRPPQWWRYSNLLERELEHVDSIIAMSEFSRAKHREFGFAREMEVLPYFLPDPTSDALPERHGVSPHPRPYFFFAGRLEKIKGLDDVIPLFRQYGDADLVIAGDGDHAMTLRASAAGMPNVVFLGRIPPDDLGRYYRHAIAALVPSVCFETFGIVLIEAFREGTPVLARRLGPFPEIIEKSGGGELFWSGEELLAAMRRLQREPARRERLSKDGYQAYVDHWSEHAVIPEYLAIVRRAALRRGHARVLDALATQEVA